MHELTTHSEVILVGGFPETVELCREAGVIIVGVIDSIDAASLMDFPVLGTDSDALNIHNDYPAAGVVLTPDAPSQRARLYRHYQEIGFALATVVHPTAVISPSASIDCGVVVHSGATITYNASIGKGVRLNVGATVMHDSVIGDFSTIAPCAVVLGRVHVGTQCYIGASSTLLPEITIGNNTTIGAGCVATKDIPDDVIVKGVPGKLVQ